MSIKLLPDQICFSYFLLSKFHEQAKESKTTPMPAAILTDNQQQLKQQHFFTAEDWPPGLEKSDFSINKFWKTGEITNRESFRWTVKWDWKRLRSRELSSLSSGHLADQEGSSFVFPLRVDWKPLVPVLGSLICWGPFALTNWLALFTALGKEIILDFSLGI